MEYVIDQFGDSLPAWNILYKLQHFIYLLERERGLDAPPSPEQTLTFDVRSHGAEYTYALSMWPPPA